MMMMMVLIMILIINKIVRKWRKLHEGETYTFCLAPNIIRLFNSWV